MPPSVHRFAAAGALVLAGIGCTGDGAPSGCTTGYLGELAAPMELELFALGEDLLPHDLAACGPIDIVQPPQGGRVLFAGVRAANLEGCNVRMAAALRDPRDGSLLGQEVRTTGLEAIAARPGWGETGSAGDPTNGFRSVANIAVCPNMSAPASPRDVQQQLGLIEIDLTDVHGKQGQVLLGVFPRCAQTDALARAACECLCQAGYTPAKCADVTSFPPSADAGPCTSQ